MTMKAWNCAIDSQFLEGCLLVFAETRNKARYLASKSVWEWPYQEVRATRAHPKFDKYATSERIIESNDQLPPGAEKFYSENYQGGYDDAM